MSSSVFRQIASGSRPERAERLFNAAVTAFCALTRPARAEVAQIDDLALSLLPHVSQSSRRYAAAALSDCAHAPPGLVRRLCEEDVETAAPLLARSPVLREPDLMALAKRHGLPHARVIAKRTDLSPAVSALLRNLLAGTEAVPPPEATAPLRADASVSGEPAENARRRLRAMMRGSLPENAEPRASGDLFAHLSDMALSDHQPFFETALADALGLGLFEARRIAATSGTLLFALHALELRPEQVFLLLAVVCPDAVVGKAGIRWVLERCAELDRELAEAHSPEASRPGGATERGEAGSSSLIPFRRARSV